MRNRQLITALVLVVWLSPAVQAAETVKPADIKVMFGTGKPFPAKAPSGKVLMLTLKPDGTATAIPKGKKTGMKGSWRVSEKGYCSTWGKSQEHCYTLAKNGDGYDVLTISGVLAAHWKAP